MIEERTCLDCFGVGYTRPHLDDEPCRRCWTLGVVEFIQSGIEHE